MKHDSPRVVWWLTIGLLAWVLVLHFRFKVSAGPLWRDEAQSAAQASMPNWQALESTLDFDTFPPLFPTLLRAASSAGLPLTDASLRSTAVILGLVLAASVVAGLRLVGVRSPWVVPLLVMADPLFISEGDSVRPYGLALTGVVWLWALTAKYLMDPAARWLAFATIAAVFSVQASYTNVLYVGVIGPCALVLEVHARRGWHVLLHLVPGTAAALSLLPLAGHVSAARAWLPVLRYAPDWRAFAEAYVFDQSAARVIGWVVLVLLAICPGQRRWGPERSPGVFSIAVGLAAWAVQIGFVYAAGVPLFPRYFLQCALLFGILLEVNTMHA